MKRIVFLIIGLISTVSSLSAQTGVTVYGFTPWLRYNKVEGAFLGIGRKFEFGETWSFLGKFGYAIAGKFPRYSGVLQKNWFQGDHEYFVSGEYFRKTETNDGAVLPDWQNSVTALLFRLDYYDQYETHGGRIRFDGRWWGVLQADVAFFYRQFHSMDNATKVSAWDWGGEKIGGKKIFAPNAQAVEGNEAGIRTEIALDTRPSPNAFVNAWLIRADYTNASAGKSVAKTDLAYQRAGLQITRFQKLFTRHKMFAQTRLGSYQGKTTFTEDAVVLPRDQFLFDAGGYGSVRGYDYKAFANGNRLWTANWEYYFNGAFLPKTPLTRIWGIGKIFRMFDLTFFADAGQVWNQPEEDPFVKFGGARFSKFKTSAGGGLAASDWLRIDWAFPLSRAAGTKRGDPTIYFRLNVNL